MSSTFKSVLSPSNSMPEHRINIFELGRRALLAILVATLYLGCGSAQAAELVVFEAHGTSLQPGQLVDGNSAIKLEDGQRVTLISKDGRVLTLIGPFNGATAPLLKQGGAGVFDALQWLVSTRQIDTSTAGITRSYGIGKGTFRPVLDEPVAALPGPWMVDITTPGDWCYRIGGRIELWHPKEYKIERIDITKLDERWMTVSEWPSGSQTIPLPADTPITDNAKFWFTVNGKDALIAFRAVPEGIPSREAVAAWMAGKNCVRQARALVAKSN
jgi:hypothetical protein